MNPGVDHGSPGVDHTGRRLDQLPDVSVRPHSEDPGAVRNQGLGSLLGRVAGPHVGIDDREIGTGNLGLG